MFWVELLVQMRLCPIFMSGVGLPDFLWVDGLSTDSQDLGCHSVTPRNIP